MATTFQDVIVLALNEDVIRQGRLCRIQYESVDIIMFYVNHPWFQNELQEEKMTLCMLDYVILSKL